MICGEIKGRLLDYMEGTLTPEQKQRVDEHLISCEKCSESLADLQKTVLNLKNLEEIEPPPWLTRKVMARIREEEAKKGLLRRLFYPLHIKLPIEAAATVLIAVTAFYVFKTTQPEMKVAEAPREAAQQTYSQERDKSRTEQEIGKIPAPSAPSEKKHEVPPSAMPPYSKEVPRAPSLKRLDESASSAGAVSKDEMKQEPSPAAPGKRALALGDMPAKTAEDIEQKAVSAANDWLALIDGRRYAESRETSAEYFRNAVPKEQWDRSLLEVRKPLGKVFKRKLRSKQYTKTLPGRPDGDYLVIQYDTSFENKESAVETVTTMLDKDGVWRVSGYNIR